MVFVDIFFREYLDCILESDKLDLYINSKTFTKQEIIQRLLRIIQLSRTLIFKFSKYLTIKIMKR